MIATLIDVFLWVKILEVAVPAALFALMLLCFGWMFLHAWFSEWIEQRRERKSARDHWDATIKKNRG